MAETSEPLLQTQQPNAGLQSLFHVLDPISLIHSQNSSPTNPIPLRLTTESCIMERGPRYRAYAELRETKLRMKSGVQMQPPKEVVEFKQTPTKKQVRFTSSSLAQSVPDFSATLKKENRKPPAIELTPPNSRGSKSANAAEKKGRLMMLKKSYARVEDLKGFSLAAANAINGENRGGMTGSRGVVGNNNNTILRYRQI